MAPPGRTPTSRSAKTRAAISRARTSKADIARDLDAARGRKEFFSSRPNVSDDRAERRMKQADELQRFKNLYTKPVYTDTGSRVTGVTQMKLDAPRTLEQERQRLVKQYGPTTREVMGDIGYGLGNIGKGISDFIGRGGAIGSVLSDLFSRVKGGTTQGIESVKGVYDNLRKNLSGEPTITTGGGSTIFTTTEEPFKDLTPRNDILVEPLETLPSQMSNEEFDNSFPFLPDRASNLDNPLFNQQVYDPIRVSDMDMSGVMASNMGQNVIGNLQNLQNLANKYNLNRIQFDPLNPNRIGYSDQFMFNQTPVNYNISATPTGLQGGLNFTFKDGGSVDKYAGLGYKLK
jgi:hypothetical protein